MKPSTPTPEFKITTGIWNILMFLVGIIWDDLKSRAERNQK